MKRLSWRLILTLVLILLGAGFAIQILLFPNFRKSSLPPWSAYIFEWGYGIEAYIPIKYEMRLNYFKNHIPGLTDEPRRKAEFAGWYEMKANYPEIEVDLKEIAKINGKKLLLIVYRKKGVSRQLVRDSNDQEPIEQYPEEVVLAFETFPGYFRPFYIIEPEYFQWSWKKTKSGKKVFSAYHSLSGTGGIATDIWYSFEKRKPTRVRRKDYSRGY